MHSRHFFFPKLNAWMPDQAFQQLQKLLPLKINDPRSLARKQFLQDPPEFFVKRIQPIGLTRQCREQTLLTIQHRPEPNHHLPLFPGSFHLQRQHHLKLQLLSFLRNFRPAILYRSSNFLGHALRIDHFQSQRDDMRAHPPVFSHHQTGASVFHMCLGNNFHRYLLHLASHAKLARQHPVLVLR